ncbi:MAG: tRNA preQ1(34) S-adenosylmethionine ribosyltransferase-isomerase QueA [Gallionella sp.]
MRTDDFDFDLPEHLIAQHPPTQRGASRLLCLHEEVLEDSLFVDLLKQMQSGDVCVLNDTRVIKARLFGIKQSGGQVEVLVERVLNEHEVLAQVRASKSPKAGSFLQLAKGSPQSGGVPSDMPLAGKAKGSPQSGGVPSDMPLHSKQEALGATLFSGENLCDLAGADALSVEVKGREGEFFHLRFTSDIPVLDLLERYGRLPLPPYITHAADEEDDARYQTVYAHVSGAVAAPTAGLHFNDAMLQALREKGVKIVYVTLHVGAGTFQPVRAVLLEDHVMHSERYEIPQATVDVIAQARMEGQSVVAVGTTSLRALESAAASGAFLAGTGETRIFITPGYRFRVVDVLLTNFHLPKSTLLMLVSAFGGMEEMRAAYRHAVKQEYRFFSYGDAMLIKRKMVSSE